LFGYLFEYFLGVKFLAMKLVKNIGLPRWLGGKESTCSAGRKRKEKRKRKVLITFPPKALSKIL